MNSVVLIDDHDLVRKGISMVVDSFNNFEIIEQFDLATEFQEYLKYNEKPHLVIVDLFMPVYSGFELIAWLNSKHSEILCLALTIDVNEDSTIKAMRAGARGIIRKNSNSNQLLIAMTSIINTGYYHTSQIQQVVSKNPNLLTESERERNELISRLTPRESEFLKELCAPDEPIYSLIAKRMSVSPRTIDYYRSELFSKFDIKSKSGLVSLAHRLGFTNKVNKI